MLGVMFSVFILVRMVCRRTHLFRHHGKASTLLTGASGFHGGIQGQDIGLEGNGVDQADDVANLAAGRGNFFHAVHHLLYHGTALRSRLRSRCRQLIRYLRRRCRLLHRGRELRERGHGLLQIARRLLGTHRQVAIAHGNFAGRRFNAVAGIAQPADHAVQIGLHGLQSALQR